MLEILFVGTGDAFGSGGRRNSAILVRNGEQTLLVDCGPTTLLGLQQLGVDPREIDAIAISHFHGDHAAGVPFLLLDYLYEHPRHKQLEILGPPGIAERVVSTTATFHYEGELERRYELRFAEYECGTPRELAGFVVTASPAHHHPETRPHMLRLETDDRAIFFSGDTGWHEQLPNRVGDVNLFISECVFMEECFEYHLSHERLKLVQERFSSDRIILTHLGSQVLDNLDRVGFETASDGLRLKI